ncbi:MAG: S9 family peptidase, partial [Solirubrobacterales bacterium]
MSATAPYGSWDSPIDAAAVARGGRRLGSAALAADDAVWWAEGRPSEGGRVALMRRPAGGEPEEMTPTGVNVRTRVHEYGGGAWSLVGDRALFVDFGDQRLYGLQPGEEPIALAPEPAEPAALRYADFRLSADGRTVVCVRERHGEGEPVNEIVAIALADPGAEPVVLVGGHDFFSFP